MDFESYYSATEEAFAQEKIVMLDKIDQLQKCWNEAAELDHTLVNKCKDMMELKRMIGKGHLQILRTREECLQMELKNAQLRFHNRQLQGEIFRLLPYSHSEVPSTEYHMSLDRKVFKSSNPKNKIEADQEHLADLKRIHKKWVDICEQQQSIFAEENLHYSNDEEQWKKFTSSVNSQNASTQKLIDTQLAELTQKYIDLKKADDELLRNGQETVDGLAKKIKRLENRTQTTLLNLEQKRAKDKQLASKEAARMTKEMRRRVDGLQTKNQTAIEDLQAENERLEDEEDDYLYDVEVLEARANQREEENKGLYSEGKARIDSLEAQLNALISAAAAIKVPTPTEELNIIGAVSSAMGAHGKSAMRADRVNKRLGHLSRRIEAECLNLE